MTPCDVLAVGAHPDDVELGCGATLARLAAGGRRLGVVDLTAGELATRGDRTTRHQEATRAAQALGVAWRACLDLPDGALTAADRVQNEALVVALRTAAPRVVLLPHADDPHPDHGAAAALAMRAVFLAGVARYHPASGPASRPHLLLAYPGPRQLVAPDLVIDVGVWYGRKREALTAYASQFAPAGGAPTHLATGHFLAAVEGRDRAAGNTIGVEFGEGFTTVGTLSADEIAWLLKAKYDGKGPGTTERR